MWQFSPYALLMLLGGVMSLVIAHLTWRRRPAPGATALAATNLCGALWAIFWGLALASTSFGRAQFFYFAGFMGIESLGPCLFAFAAEYSGRDQWINRKTIAILSVMPVVNLAIIWASPWAHIYIHGLQLDSTGGYTFLREIPAPWFWVDSATAYVTVALALMVLISMLVREPGLYRRQITAILAAIVLPFAVDAMYILQVPGMAHVNLSPAMFGWAGLVLYWAFTRLQLLDVTPAAREFIIERLTDAVVVTDTGDRILYLNSAAQQVLGIKLRAVAGKPVAQAINDWPELVAAYDDTAVRAEEAHQEWQRHGRVYHGRLAPMLDARKRPRGRMLVLRNITARKEAELALEETRRQLEVRVEERTAELAAEKDRLSGLNAVALEVAHCMTTNEVLSAGLRLACDALACDTAAFWLTPRNGRARLAATSGFRTSERQCLREVLSIWEPPDDHRACAHEAACGLTGLAIVPLVARRLSLGALCLHSADPDYWQDEERLSLATGIASQIALALQNAKRYDDAQFLAERDSLTRLFNHRGLTRRVEQQVAHAAQGDQVFSVAMMDIDNFKLFNDAHGHVMGDKVLQAAARSLTSTLRRSDVAARCGGDEFVAVLADCDGKAAINLLERVRVELQKRSLTIEGQIIPIRMSYGVATFPRDGIGASELLAVADANLYRSKRRGGDCVTASGTDDAGETVPTGSFTVLDGLVTTVDTKDHYTRRHSEDVTEYAVAIARRLGLSPDTERSLRIAALLHDVGKVGVPDHILRKPALLTVDELAAVRQHVTLGELIIKGIPNQNEVVEAISTHHERWDGEGYPRGLKAEDIPLLGRILAVADAYSAMITDRPYRQALALDDAREELRRVAGSQLDAHVVAAFLELLLEEDVEAAEAPPPAYAPLIPRRLS